MVSGKTAVGIQREKFGTCETCEGSHVPDLRRHLPVVRGHAKFQLRLDGTLLNDDCSLDEAAYLQLVEPLRSSSSGCREHL